MSTLGPKYLIQGCLEPLDSGRGEVWLRGQLFPFMYVHSQCRTQPGQQCSPRGVALDTVDGCPTYAATSGMAQESAHFAWRLTELDIVYEGQHITRNSQPATEADGVLNWLCVLRWVFGAALLALLN